MTPNRKALASFWAMAFLSTNAVAAPIMMPAPKSTQPPINADLICPAVAKAASPPVSLAPLTEQVAAGGHADFILSAPPGTPPLTSLGYTIQITGKSAQSDLLKQPITSQQATPDQIKQAGLTDGGNAAVLRVEVPAAGRLNPLALSEDWTVSMP